MANLGTWPREAPTAPDNVTENYPPRREESAGAHGKVEPVAAAANRAE